VGDVVWAKEHRLCKGAEGFAAKLAPRYADPYKVVDFVSPVICKIRHIHTLKERTIHVGEQGTYVETFGIGTSGISELGHR